jgi:2-deoxy-D-gluconate 3-dehydrogenase
MNLFDLSGRKALVTGGSGGLGRAVAEALRDFGAEVGLSGASERVRTVAAEMSQGGARVVSLQADLGRREERGRLFAQAIERLGRVDILITAHGLTDRHKAEDFPLTEWDRTLEVNLSSVFELCQLAGREMLARGEGKIINIASLLSFSGGIMVPAYAASKGGVAQITKALANEWAGRGVNVNAIAPGYFDTPLTANLKNDPTRNRQILERIPAGRWGAPADLKGAVVFLASHASDYVHGVVLPVDGGWMAR